MPINIVLNKLIILLLITGLLTACSYLPTAEDPTKDWSASQLYSEAKAALNGQDYQQAIDYFEKLEARYPFGQYAQQAQLEIAYAHYQYEEPDAAIAAANRFIKLYPRHPHVDYAYYLKGLANFERGKSIIDQLLPRDPTKRDPGSARQSFFDFAELVKRFPNSIYAEDSRQRMTFLRNNLAYYELHVAEYYFQREAYVAAINRAQYIITHFQGATAMPKALLIMAKAYDKLGIHDLAQEAQTVYEHNYAHGQTPPASEAAQTNLFERLLLWKSTPPDKNANHKNTNP